MGEVSKWIQMLTVICLFTSRRQRRHIQRHLNFVFNPQSSPPLYFLLHALSAVTNNHWRPFKITCNCWLWLCSLCFHRSISHKLILPSGKLVSMHRDDSHLFSPFHYLLATLIITQFAAYPTVALSDSRSGLKHQLNVNGKSKSGGG